MTTNCPECFAAITTTIGTCTECGWPDARIERDEQGNIKTWTTPRGVPYTVVGVDLSTKPDVTVDTIVIQKDGEPSRIIIMNPVNDLLACVKAGGHFTDVTKHIDRMDEEQLRWALGTLSAEYGGLKKLYDFACEKMVKDRAG